MNWIAIAALCALATASLSCLAVVFYAGQLTQAVKTIAKRQDELEPEVEQHGKDIAALQALAPYGFKPNGRHL